jgi:hypothetical protein
MVEIRWGVIVHLTVALGTDLSVTLPPGAPFPKYRWILELRHKAALSHIDSAIRIEKLSDTFAHLRGTVDGNLIVGDHPLQDCSRLLEEEKSLEQVCLMQRRCRGMAEFFP